MANRPDGMNTHSRPIRASSTASMSRSICSLANPVSFEMRRAPADGNPKSFTCTGTTTLVFSRSQAITQTAFTVAGRSDARQHVAPEGPCAEAMLSGDTPIGTAEYQVELMWKPVGSPLFEY